MSQKPTAKSQSKKETRHKYISHKREPAKLKCSFVLLPKEKKLKSQLWKKEWDNQRNSFRKKTAKVLGRCKCPPAKNKTRSLTYWYKRFELSANSHHNSHPEFSSGSHREPHISFCADRCWNLQLSESRDKLAWTLPSVSKMNNVKQVQHDKWKPIAISQ